ncbi:hypothetical protein [Burkholderia sp.]|uniref:hypothetical protein n=1 Tax=Burkholderia sp. TaxID=36773 RepID=UPI00258EBAC2|nr:hypothetical protein [Burkholderia sp.]MCL4632823.1 hypothetical protein [Burkholderia sp.]
MEVLVVLVARHKLALKIFEDEGRQLLNKEKMPPEIADMVSLRPCTFDPDRAKGVALDRFILQGGAYEETPDASPVDGVVVLYDMSLSYALKGVRNAIFAAEVQIGYLENVRNFLIGNFSILLGNYGLFLQIVQDGTRLQAVSLPIRNFDAEELRALVDLFQTRTLEKTFQNEIVPKFNKLLKLRGPKRRSKYPNVYFKDERNRYFEFGHERHSRYETGEAHNLACLMNGKFRFGGVLDQERHFNVTVGNSDARELITCDLPNCHDEPVIVKGRTHINMFSNDFHK